MATLHVRNVPDRLYERIRKRAGKVGRSLSAELVALIERGLEEAERRSRQGHLFKGIRKRRFTPPPGTPDSTDLIREDRDR